MHDQWRYARPKEQMEQAVTRREIEVVCAYLEVPGKRGLRHTAIWRISGSVPQSGLLFMVPALFFMDFKLEAGMFTGMINIGNILYLGIGASAICFVSWNKVMGILGVVKTSVYIYLVPVVTMIFSTLILKEPLTPVLVAGAALTLAAVGKKN